MDRHLDSLKFFWKFPMPYNTSVGTNTGVSINRHTDPLSALATPFLQMKLPVKLKEPSRWDWPAMFQVPRYLEKSKIWFGMPACAAALVTWREREGYTSALVEQSGMPWNGRGAVSWGNCCFLLHWELSRLATWWITLAYLGLDTENHSVGSDSTPT